MGKPIIKDFSVKVTDSTLEICFYWAGRGTMAIPHRKAYGPLIYAIYVNYGMPYTFVSAFRVSAEKNQNFAKSFILHAIIYDCYVNA